MSGIVGYQGKVMEFAESGCQNIRIFNSQFILNFLNYLLILAQIKRHDI
jgi:hypothetical protein